ncbi:MAG TPA: protein kinase [Polyangia bacterium]|nr:protein kinase [Polyangia bacterium]
MSESSAAQAVAAPNGLIAPGTQVGRYEIVHRIACGGMAEIYLARASGIYGFEKYVVLKRILPQYAANAEFVRMFLKEARVAASLDHANIAHVYDIGETGGSTFFAMEYLHGEDLRHTMRDLDARKAKLPLEHALEIVMGAAAGLHFAHEKRGPDGRSLGIVHRDVSPANIVITYDGGVRVVDFGIAKLAADPELSQRYALKGKLAYMAPEQLHNQPVDRRCDVFSLGIVLYEITTQSRLFKGATEVQTMKALLDGVVPPPSSLVPDYPPALERIVMRALAMNPDQRYQSARDLQVDLEAFVHEQRIRVSPAALAEWMESTFGPKQEIWYTLPQRPSASAARTNGEATAATKVVEHEGLAATPIAIPAGISVGIEFSSPMRPPPRRRWSLVVAAVAVLGSAALLMMRGQLPWARNGAEPPSPVVVVAEGGNVAVERNVAPASAEAAPGAQAAPTAAPPSRPTPAPAAATPTVAPRTKRVAEEGAAPHGAGFSETFARREGDIRRCFVEHPQSGGTTEISLRFEVARDGHVGSVAVLPSAVGSSPLGACLAAVGKSTVFSKQSAPVTFRIPLTVQREAPRKSESESAP